MSDTSSNHNTSNNILIETGTNEVEFLEFLIGKGKYGVNVAKVNRVIVFDPNQVSELPGEERLGVIGTQILQDEPILVVDLAALIRAKELSSEEKSQPKLLLILEFNQRTTGFVVHGVNSIKRTSWADFKRLMSPI